MPTNDHSAVASVTASPWTTAAIAAIAATICLLVNPAAGHTASVKGAVVGTGTSSLGRILVDSRGRTLYLFEKDKTGKNACSGKGSTPPCDGGTGTGMSSWPSGPTPAGSARI